MMPPLVFALLTWFIGTAAVVWLDSRPRETFQTSHRLGGIVALAATAVIAFYADDGTVEGAYIAFAAAIAIWGWHEMGFLMGFVAGPRRLPCPPEAKGWERFRMATATVIHHEIALGATLLLLVALTWGQANQTGPLTFALLFGMRLSAKCNLYLGVPNLSDEVFPAHLEYLKSYFRKRACNFLYPFSLAGGIAVTLWAWAVSEAAPVANGTWATGALLAGFAALGVIEHLFLVLPIKDAAMWQWAVSSAKSAKRGSAVQPATIKAPTRAIID
jgi:putative photosynthetic complex assembly protein 2